MNEQMYNNSFEGDETPALEVGRHTGRTFLDVAINQPQYCSWILQKEDLNENLQKFADWLKDHYVADEPEVNERDIDVKPDDDASQILGFGPHQGRTYVDMALNEPGWCCAVREVHNKNEDQERFADWLDSFEQEAEATAASGEIEVEAENYEYWVEKEDTNAVPDDEELEGIVHADPAARALGCWDCTWSPVDCNDSSSSGDDDSLFQDLFSVFLEEEPSHGLSPEQRKRKRDEAEPSDSCHTTTKHQRTSDVMLALAEETSHLTPPDLDLE